ncbi:MAG: aminopeptidase P family protein [Desulfamplus sp.]|nr:aminopeptidase P family protein [Desulfamplus sp.]
MFKSEIYIQRRNRLKQQLSSSIGYSGIALFIGHDESPINFTDNSYPFRQDSSFLYFFGHNLPKLIGVIDIDEGIDYLFGNDAGIDELIWTGPQPTIKELGERVGISRTGGIKKFESFFQRACSYKRKIHFLPPYRKETVFKLLKWFRIVDITRIGDISSDLEILPSQKLLSEKALSSSIKLQPSIELIKAVVAQREIKTDEEIAHIEEAVNISAKMHIEAMRVAKHGMTEQQVVSAIYKKMLDAGASLNSDVLSNPSVSMAFTPIATTRGETLHNHFYGNVIKKGDLFLLDAGVESSMHYASDLSTTFPVDGKLTTIQKEIYQITLDAHKKAVLALAPKIPFKDVHFKACKTIVNGLKDVGLMKGNVDDAVALGAHALFFPCGTGHMMGLDAHDMEDLGEVYVGYDGEPKSEQFGLKSLRLAKPLKAGFVLTVEPGIYFIPALIDKWRAENKFLHFINYKALEQYRKFGGIRNEEDYLITETGARLLGKSPLPYHLIDGNSASN